MYVIYISLLRLFETGSHYVALGDMITLETRLEVTEIYLLLLLECCHHQERIGSSSG